MITAVGAPGVGALGAAAGAPGVGALGAADEVLGAVDDEVTTLPPLVEAASPWAIAAVGAPGVEALGVEEEACGAVEERASGEASISSRTACREPF